MYSPLAYQVIPMTPTHYTYRSRGISAVVVHYTACIVYEAVNIVNGWERSDPYRGSNYIIDVTGRITAVVPEERRAYTSSSWGQGSHDIDDRAITIECSCNYVPPNINDQARYTESEETIDACCRLMADIGKRYGIETWVFVNDPSGNYGNVHAHRWYDYKDHTPCPGDVLYSKLPEIAYKANAIMEKDKPMTVDERKEFDELKETVATQAKQIDMLTTIVNTHTQVRYNDLDDIPEWGRSEISWMLSKGYIKGTEAGLQMNYDMLRNNVINARAFEDVTKYLEEIKKALEKMA